jgi:hypothetical protein
MNKLKDLGCAACAELFMWVPAEIHHILEGNKRLGHWYTIPLCSGHHRSHWFADLALVIPKDKQVSIAHGRKEFLKHYSSERDMWVKVQKKLKLPTGWPVSKRVQR